MRETEKKYLKWYQKIAYGAGDLASNTSYGLVSSFVLLYLSDTMGLNTGIIGTLMLVSKFLDGISDVIFGNLIDRTKSKLGKARPWMLYAQIGVSLCLVLLFSIPGGLGTTAQYAYFFAFYTALNAIFYTANGIAYSALSALITRNKNERVQLGSIRFMFAVATNIVMGFAVTNGVEAFGGGAAGWRMVAIICGTIGLVVNTIKEILQAEQKLGVKIPAPFVWFLKEFGSGGYWFDFIGYTKNGKAQFVEETFNQRENGLPKNLLVIEDCDEFYHCLDTSNGKIASWSQYDNDGVIYCFDNFYDFFKDNLENAIENF